MRAAVKNAADPEQVKRAGKKDKSKEELFAEDLRFVLQSINGRRFLYRLLEETRIYETSFTGNSETFFREGRRDVGLWLLSQIESADGQAYLRMLGEKQMNGG